MRLSVGDDRTRAWLRDIKDNDPTLLENNIQTEEAIARGEIDVGFVNHYYLYELGAEQPGFPVANHFLRAGDPGHAGQRGGRRDRSRARSAARRRGGSSTSCSRARASASSPRRRSSTR